MSEEQLRQRIATLEASLRRMDEFNEDEIDEDEYANTLHELVKLREIRDGSATEPPTGDRDECRTS